MLKYAVILLDDSSVPFCSYDVNRKRNPISLSDLKSAVVWAMKENLEIQFIYPDYDIGDDALCVINSVSHTNVMHYKNTRQDKADILIINGLNELQDVQLLDERSYVIRLLTQNLFEAVQILSNCPTKPLRINFLFPDRNEITKNHLPEYLSGLEKLKDVIVNWMSDKHYILQTNLITDRVFLKGMNNCNAGIESITVAPNGMFYICPAFYYDNRENSCGDICSGLHIPNRQLYDLEHAPICSHCDAFQCNRCVWLNKISTREVNTPSQGQCMSSHIERTVSAEFLKVLKERRITIDEIIDDIPEITYIDPFENRRQWN